MKYKVGDKVVFKYQTLNRLGVIEAIEMVKDLKGNKCPMYSIRDMSPNIALRENSIVGVVDQKPKPMFRMKILNSTRG